LVECDEPHVAVARFENRVAVETADELSFDESIAAVA
jgi:hypothetical protein